MNNTKITDSNTQAAHDNRKRLESGLSIGKHKERRHLLIKRVHHMLQASHFDNDCNRHKKQRQEHQRPLDQI